MEPDNSALPVVHDLIRSGTRARESNAASIELATRASQYATAPEARPTLD